jgi:hypothetical protein
MNDLTYMAIDDLERTTSSTRFTVTAGSIYESVVTHRPSRAELRAKPRNRHAEARRMAAAARISRRKAKRGRA